MLSLYLHLSSLNLCHLIFAVVLILFGLDCFINSVLAYFHILHVHCLIISLNWYFVIWGSKRSRYITHYLNIRIGNILLIIDCWWLAIGLYIYIYISKRILFPIQEKLFESIANFPIQEKLFESIANFNSSTQNE